MQTNTCYSGQVLLVNHCSNLLGTFFRFCFKSKHSTFLTSGEYFSNNSNNNKTPPALARHQRMHVTHASHASTQPTPATLARHPCKHATHATHASTPPMPPTLARHPRKHATQASTNSTPFLKLAKEVPNCQVKP